MKIPSEKRDDCPVCGGSGREVVVLGAGTPEEVEDERNCFSCFGTGVVGGQEDVIAELEAEAETAGL